MVQWALGALIPVAKFLRTMFLARFLFEILFGWVWRVRMGVESGGGFLLSVDMGRWGFGDFFSFFLLCNG